MIRALLAPLTALTALTLLIPVSAEAVDPQYQNNMRIARRYVAQGHHDLAVNIYRRVLQQHPKDMPAVLGLSESLVATDRLAEADSLLGVAAERIGPKPDLYRARVQLRRAQQRPDDALDDLLTVLDGGDELASWAFRELKDLTGEDGLDPDRARKEAENRHKQNPEAVRFAVLAALAQSFAGEDEKALRYMLRVDRKQKLAGKSVLRYAEELQGMGNEPAALEGLIAAVDEAEKPAQRSRILFKVAEIQQRQGKFEDALASLDTVVREREGTSAGGRALLESALIHQRHLHDPQRALAVYEKIKDDPVLGHHRADMLLQMADCHVRLGNFSAAAATYHEVLPDALDPEQAESALLKLAEVEFFRGNPDTALILYQDMAEQNARSLFADDAAGRYIILNRYQSLGGGEVLRLFGRLEWARHVGDSLAVAQAAAELKQNHPQSELYAEALLALADMDLAGGNDRAALGRLETLVAEFPRDRRAPKALMRQGEILTRLDRGPEALMRYERVLTDYSDSIEAGEARRRVGGLRRALKS